MAPTTHSRLYGVGAKARGCMAGVQLAAVRLWCRVAIRRGRAVAPAPGSGSDNGSLSGEDGGEDDDDASHLPSSLPHK